MGDEELEDVPQEIKVKDPLYLMKIRRKIGGTVFTGQVEDIEMGKVSKDKLYRVRYSDGDLEHYTREQVLECQDKGDRLPFEGKNVMKKPSAAAAPEEATQPPAAMEEEAEDVEMTAAPVAKKPAGKKAAEEAEAEEDEED